MTQRCRRRLDLVKGGTSSPNACILVEPHLIILHLGAKRPRHSRGPPPLGVAPPPRLYCSRCVLKPTRSVSEGRNSFPRLRFGLVPKVPSSTPSRLFPFTPPASNASS